jgi:hypothetical protein
MIWCYGEFDIAGVEAFEVAFDVVRSRVASPAPIDVDARGVTFCDSSAATTLRRAGEKCRDESRPFPIRSSRHVDRALSLVDAVTTCDHWIASQRP